MAATDHPETQPLWRGLDFLGTHVRSGRQAVGHVYVRRDRPQVGVGGVVGVEHCYLGHSRLARRGRQRPEQHRLGLAIALVAAVVVQVLMGNVGDHRHVVLAGGHPVLRQTMRGRFNDRVGHPCGHHLGQVGLHGGSIGSGGMKTGLDLLPTDLGVHRVHRAYRLPRRA